MKFQFPNTPHDGMAFDKVSAKEINDHEMLHRSLWCLPCQKAVMVNILDVVSVSEIVPEDGTDKWAELFNDTLFDISDDLFAITCPYCGMIYPTSKVGA